MLHQNPWKKGLAHLIKLGIPQAQHLTVDQAFKQNMGSAAAYIISRQGVKNLFDHINQKGMYNAIDWVIMKSGNHQRVLYSSPFLVEANCFQTDQADTDIQKDFTRIKWSDEDWDVHELEYIHDLLFKSVYFQEISNKSSKQITVKSDTLLKDEPYLSNLFNDKRVTSKFIVSKTEGTISILFSNSVQWNKIVDYVCVVPVQFIKEDDKKQLNRYTVKWFYTNRMLYIIPDKYVSQTVLSDKTFGDQFINFLNPF
jgi:hypothetical protein